METALRFLLPVKDSPNELAYLDLLPNPSVEVESETSIQLSYPAQSGYRYQLESTSDLQSTEPWDILSVQSTNRFWQTLTKTVELDAETFQRFYRVRVRKD
jgi:hypothetical protein